MKLTLELSAVQVGPDQSKYPNARFGVGKTEDGVSVVAMIFGPVSRSSDGQPRIDAAMAGVRTELFITDQQAEWLLLPRKAA